MTDIVFLALLFIHIGTIVLWMGASILYVSVLGPSIAKLSPSTRADLLKAIGSRYDSYVVRNSTIAIVAGLILYGYITQVSKSFEPSTSGMPWILAGIIFGLLAYVIGLAVVMRTNRKMMSLMAQRESNTAPSAPSSDMPKLQRRLAISTGLQALFLVIALLSMVVGASI
jgi:uncharacterized membrane protein